MIRREIMTRQTSLVLYKANLFFKKQRNVKFFANSDKTNITCAQSNFEIKRKARKTKEKGFLVLRIAIVF